MNTQPKFRIGDQVQSKETVGRLSKDQIYTVRDVETRSPTDHRIYLEEIPADHHEWRFTLAEEPVCECGSGLPWIECLDCILVRFP